MRGNLRTCIALFLWSGAVSSWDVGQEYARLEWNPELGQSAKYQVKMSHLSPMGLIEPNEIWRASSRVLAQFGKIRKIEFSRMDPPGAYLKVFFDRADREFFLQLDELGKLLGLTYVPPATPHDH